MATTSRQLVLDNIDTVLKTITIAGGYKTTIDTVERTRGAKTWEEVPSSDRPYIGIVPGKESCPIDGGHFPFGRMRVTFHIDLICYVTGSTAATRSNAISDFQDDIISVLNKDPTRDKNAMSTYVVDWESDEGSTEDDGYLLVGVDIIYNRKTSST